MSAAEIIAGLRTMHQAADLMLHTISKLRNRFKEKFIVAAGIVGINLLIGAGKAKINLRFLTDHYAKTKCCRVNCRTRRRNR